MVLILPSISEKMLEDCCWSKNNPADIEPDDCRHSLDCWCDNQSKAWCKGKKVQPPPLFPKYKTWKDDWNLGHKRPSLNDVYLGPVIFVPPPPCYFYNFWWFQHLYSSIFFFISLRTRVLSWALLNILYFSVNLARNRKGLMCTKDIARVLNSSVTWYRCSRTGRSVWNWM